MHRFGRMGEAEEQRVLPDEGMDAIVDLVAIVRGGIALGGNLDEFPDGIAHLVRHLP